MAAGADFAEAEPTGTMGVGAVVGCPVDREGVACVAPLGITIGAGAEPC